MCTKFTLYLEILTSSHAYSTFVGASNLRKFCQRISLVSKEISSLLRYRNQTTFTYAISDKRYWKVNGS